MCSSSRATTTGVSLKLIFKGVFGCWSLLVCIYLVGWESKREREKDDL